MTAKFVTNNYKMFNIPTCTYVLSIFDYLGNVDSNYLILYITTIIIFRLGNY